MVGTYQAAGWTADSNPTSGKGSSSQPSNLQNGPGSREYNPYQGGMPEPSSPYSSDPSTGKAAVMGRQQADAGALGNTNFVPSNYNALVLAQQQSMMGGGVNGLNGISSLVNTMYGPQQLALLQQAQRQQSLMDANNPYGPLGQQAHANDVLYRDSGIAHRLNDLDRQGLGLESGLAKGQLSNLSKLRDILAKQRGLTREQLDNQLGQFKIDEAKLRDNSSRAQWDLRSDLTQRGALNTVATERGSGRINRDLMYGLGGINNQRTAADIQFRNSMLGLDEKGIGYDNQQAALTTKLSQIGLNEKALGIKDEQIQNALADGLYNSGLGALTNVNSLMDAIGSNNAQQSQLGLQILQQIIGYSNLPPAVIQQIQALLGQGGAVNSVGVPTAGRPPTRKVA